MLHFYTNHVHKCVYSLVLCYFLQVSKRTASCARSGKHRPKSPQDANPGKGNSHPLNLSRPISLPRLSHALSPVIVHPLLSHASPPYPVSHFPSFVAGQNKWMELTRLFGQSNKIAIQYLPLLGIIIFEGEFGLR